MALRLLLVRVLKWMLLLLIKLVVWLAKRGGVTIIQRSLRQCLLRV